MKKQARALLAVPVWVSIVLLIAAGAWVRSATKAIQPHNDMPSRLEKPPLPIASLPRRPVMQFEFVRGPEDVKAILQVGSKAEADNVTHLKAGNDLDTRHLIPRYAVLLIVLSLLIAQGSKSIGDVVFLTALVTTVLIAGADFVENSGIDRILNAPRDDGATGSAAAMISTAAFVKWTLLGFLLIYLGVVAALQQTWRRWLTPVLFAAGVLLLAIVGRHAVERFLT